MTTDIQAALDTYGQVLEACSKQVMGANYQLAASIREALLPILHRWGIGMLPGGTFVYQQPSLKALADGKWEVHMDKDDDYALQALHSKLHDALWGGPPRLLRYSPDDTPPSTTTVHDFITAIPLPGVDTDYIWITEDEYGHWGNVTFEDSLDGPSNHLIYCGPITQAYWDDVKGQEVVAGFIDVLPAYKYVDGDFVRYYPWNQEL